MRANRALDSWPRQFRPVPRPFRAPWCPSVQDDGCGFPFAGRLAQAELDILGKGPVIIKERVRLIEGELTVESNPGSGSRLEITVPQRREAAYG